LGEREGEEKEKKSFLSYIQVSMLVKLILYGHEEKKVYSALWMACNKSMSIYIHCTVGRMRLGKAKNGKQ